MLANNEWPSLPSSPEFNYQQQGLNLSRGGVGTKGYCPTWKAKRLQPNDYVIILLCMWLNGVNCSFGLGPLSSQKGHTRLTRPAGVFVLCTGFLGLRTASCCACKASAGFGLSVQWTALDITVFLISPLLSQTASDDIRTLSVLIWASSICWSFWLNSSNFLSET